MPSCRAPRARARAPCSRHTCSWPVSLGVPEGPHQSLIKMSPMLLKQRQPLLGTSPSPASDALKVRVGAACHPPNGVPIRGTSWGEKGGSGGVGKGEKAGCLHVPWSVASPLLSALLFYSH